MRYRQEGATDDDTLTELMPGTGVFVNAVQLASAEERATVDDTLRVAQVLMHLVFTPVAIKQHTLTRNLDGRPVLDKTGVSAIVGECFSF